MKTVEMILKEEINELNNIIKITEKRLKNAQEIKGHLRIKKNKNKIEYYFKDNENNIENPNGRYMKKSEKKLAVRIAQRDYDTYVLKTAIERLRVIEIFLDKYERTALKKIYQKLSPYRRALIKAEMISDEEFVKQWEAVSYQGKSFMDMEQIIITEKGERVRSKSEKIIADKLYLLGIPYRYECPIILKGNVKIFPDFTILKMPERKEVYLEHFGMMDNSDYVNNVIYKLNTYEKNGIYLGVKLFITYETYKTPLNTRTLDGMIRDVFCLK